MNDRSGEIAARIVAVEQHLLVAVMRRDEHARLVARGEIASLKKQFAPPTPSDPRGAAYMPSDSPKLSATGLGGPG